MKKVRKKGQEEMVGFALIVIVMTVIALFVLTVYLRKPGKIYQDNEISSFLHASMLQSSSCSPEKRHTQVYNVKDLIKSCGRRSEKCSNDKDSCNVLTETITDLLDKSWNVNENSKYQGYKLVIWDKSTQANVVSPVSKGSPVGPNKYTSGILIPDGGYIVNLTFYSK